MSGILDWKAEFIQASLFVLGPHSKGVAEIFEVAFQSEPANTQSNSNPQFGRLGVASTNTPERAMVASLQPNRCDITMNTAHDVNNLNNFSGKIADVAETIEAVNAAAARVVDLIGGAARLAVHCRFVRQTSDHAASNAALLKTMPYKLHISDEEDFILQFNYPTSLSGETINRIVKWSAENVLVQFETGVSGYVPQISTKEAKVAVVHLDFNTPPSSITYTPDRSKKILSLLSAEIAKARKNELRFKT